MSALKNECGDDLSLLELTVKTIIDKKSEN